MSGVPSDGLTVLWRALDAAPHPVEVFVRDDDAGWDDDALFRLLDLMQAVSMPIDLAVIPQVASQQLALQLMQRQDAAPGLIGIHQHGWAHLNHEPEGRRCEFGDSRSEQAQRSDVRAGRERLLSLFGTRLDAIFTPPWNRCSSRTPALLAESGLAALSRSRSALPQDALPELPVDVDWCRHEREAAASGHSNLTDRVGLALTARIIEGGPVGLMLHHAAMDSASLQQLRPLLIALRTHPRARCQLMRDLLGLTDKGRTCRPQPALPVENLS
jgi:hypothetical protein